MGHGFACFSLIAATPFCLRPPRSRAAQSTFPTTLSVATRTLAPFSTVGDVSLIWSSWLLVILFFASLVLMIIAKIAHFFDMPKRPFEWMFDARVSCNFHNADFSFARHELSARCSFFRPPLCHQLSGPRQQYSQSKVIDVEWKRLLARTSASVYASILRGKPPRTHWPRSPSPVSPLSHTSLGGSRAQFATSG